MAGKNKKDIMIKISVIVKLKVEGLHSWKKCDIKEVDYLKNLHRHTFGFTCEKLVTHTDRDIEFIKFKHEVEAYLRENYWCAAKNCHLFDGKSCEMLAGELLEEFDLIKCSVDEDEEFYGVVERIAQ